MLVVHTEDLAGNLDVIFDGNDLIFGSCCLGTEDVFDHGLVFATLPTN